MEVHEHVGRKPWTGRIGLLRRRRGCGGLRERLEHSLRAPIQDRRRPRGGGAADACSRPTWACRAAWWSTSGAGSVSSPRPSRSTRSPV